MTATSHRCPICLRTVQQTRGGNIFGHFDRAHNPCPGSYQPFTLTLTDTPIPPPDPAA